jgi:hypothetical protein
MKKVLTFFTLFILFSNLSFSQWEDRFEKIADANAKLYAQPFATAFGTAMNSGAFHSASISDLFGFSISFQGMYILIPDDQLTFTPTLPEGYTATSTTATIFGNKGAAYAGPDGYITLPPGLDVSAVPMAMPQIGLSFMGTQVLLRYLPDIDVGGKKLGLFGIGVKHSISRYIPLVPVDIAAQVLYSTFKITDLIDVKNLAFNAHASKSFGILTPYFGLQYESTSLDLTYDIKGDPASGDPNLRTDKKISLSLDGDNSFRAVLDASVKLAVVVLNADMNLGSQTTFCGGLSFEF